MAFLLPQSSPSQNLIANGSEIGGVFLGNLLRNQLPQIGNLVFNHQIPQDLIQKWQAKLDSRDAPLNPPLIEVASTVVKPFFDSPNVGTAKALIQKFQEQINQFNPNITKPLTIKSSSPPPTLSSTTFPVSKKDAIYTSPDLQSASKATSPDSVKQVAIVNPANIDSSNNISPDLQSVSQATSPDLVKQVAIVNPANIDSSSKILESPSVPERASISPTCEAFGSPSRSLPPEPLANQIASYLSLSPLQKSQQDLSPQRSQSPILIVGAQVKKAERVAEEGAGRVDDSQSISCFAKISPEKTFSPQKLLTNLGDPAEYLRTDPQSPQPFGTNHNPLRPQKQPPPPSNKNNSTSCFDEALKFFTDLIEKCCEPTRVPAKPVAKSRLRTF